MLKFTAIMRYLLRPTIYFAEPIPNINWLRNFAPILRCFPDFSITVVDVGSRGGLVPDLEPLAPWIDFIGFDADAEAVRQDSLSTDRSRKTKSQVFLNTFVGPLEQPEGVTFYHYLRPAESSTLEPNPEFQEFWDPKLRVVSQDTVPTMRLPSAIDAARIHSSAGWGDSLDYLKLDTQGTEYEIIESSREFISRFLVVNTEIEFFPIYKNQHLFGDVFNLLNQDGFILLHLNRFFRSRRSLASKSHGIPVGGGALFGMSFERAKSLDRDRKLRYIILLINYGVLDFAHDLAATDPTLMAELKSAGALVDGASEGRGIVFWARLLIVTQIDKLLFWWLAFRKTNGLPYDSDLSYPYR